MLRRFALYLLAEQVGGRSPGRVHKNATDTLKQAAGSQVSEIPFARLVPGPGREIETCSS